MDNEKLSQYEKNLICFLRMYQNRPLHLAKYLSKNNYLKENFVDDITNSKKLLELSHRYDVGELPNIYFMNFKEMLKFFENISNDYNLDGINTEKIKEELNTKLDELVKTERYEEAIKVRDFMIQNNIKRKND